jgi:hypothetical protein
MGTMLMVLGAALSIIARALIGGWFTTPLGIALQLIAVGLIAAGLAMQQIGKGMADMAKQMGSALAARTGDIAQQALVNECTDQALEGTNVNDCRVGEDLSHREHMQTIEQDGERRHRENEQTNNQVLQQGPTP